MTGEIVGNFSSNGISKINGMVRVLNMKTFPHSRQTETGTRRDSDFCHFQ
jgi:hypothetical protein